MTTMQLFIPGVPRNANARGGKWLTVKDRARFRRLTCTIASEEAARINWVAPSFTRITAQHQAKYRRRRDPSGLAERLKGILDGLVDAKVIPDDDEQHIELLLARATISIASEPGIHLTLAARDPS